MDEKDNPYVPRPVRVLEYVRDTAENFTLSLDIRLANEPGQFVQVSLLGIGEAPISIASWGGDRLTLHIHEIGNVTRALGRCRAGDIVFVRGPYGNGFPMSEAWGRNLVVVGGGCGVAPVKGAVEYVERHRDAFRDITVFLGYRNADEVVFGDSIDRWREGFPVYVSLDTLKQGHCYNASEGFVSDLLRETDIPFGETVAIVCGPPIMMRLVGEALLDKGLHEERILVSMERLMYCAVGTCCHCMIGEKYTCRDGPVFRWDAVKEHLQ